MPKRKHGTHCDIYLAVCGVVGIMLRLRLKEGFSLSEYKSAFGLDFCTGREALLSRLQEAGYISLTDDRISLTEQGFYISNSILTELI